MFNCEFVVGIKPGDYGLAIGYQIDEFTNSCSLEYFIAQSHIYPGFMGKVSTLAYFLLEPGCEDYSFLDLAVEDFEHDLDFILTDSVYTSNLDASLDEADVISSSVSSGFLCSVNTVSDTSRPQLAPSIRSHKLCYQARTLLLPVLLAGRMSASKLIHYNSGHPVTFGFWTSCHQIISL